MEVLRLITEPVLNLKPTSDHNDRYEKLEAFIKEQRDFNKNIKSHISSNSIEISECTIELKDLEQKSKNQAKEVKLSCENHIQAVKDEIGEEVQKLAKQIANEAPLGVFGIRDIQGKNYRDTGYFEEKVIGIQDIEKWFQGYGIFAKNCNISDV